MSSLKRNLFLAGVFMNARCSRILALFLLAFGLAAGPAHASSIVFADGDFSTWTAQAIVGGVGGQTAAPQAVGGNPDAFLAVTTMTGAVTFTAHLNPAFVYDPSLGAIDFIEASLDFRNIDSFGQGQGVYTVLVEQAGSYFVAGNFITGSSVFTWQSRSMSQYAPADFVRLAGNGSLDFGTTGAPITLGFVTGNDGGNGIRVGYDNFRAVVVSGSVPEPATAWYLAVGAAALAALRRRPRAAPRARVSLAAGFLSLAALAGEPARAVPIFTDWVSVDSVNVDFAVTDGSSSVFANSSYFTPAVPFGDYVEIQGSLITPFTYTITFSAPVVNPILHVGSLASRLFSPESH